ncbi:MAG: divalent metal cation transporter, partial [Pirellulaceae bacterium]
MSEAPENVDPAPKRGLLGVLGPAVIVASVVLGPGSILTNSKVGTQFGYQMIWILLSAGFLMFALTSFSARLGVIYERSFGDEIAARLGRPMAILIGVTVFLI